VGSRPISCNECVSGNFWIIVDFTQGVSCINKALSLTIYMTNYPGQSVMFQHGRLEVSSAASAALTAESAAEIELPDFE
jgi:hypothetical protein